MGRGLNVLAASALLFILCSCTPQNDALDNSFIRAYGTTNPIPSNFFVCYGYGCKYRTRITLTDGEWLEVRAKFSPAAENAAQERTQIADAVALIERFVMRRTGTVVHQEHSRWNYGDPTQLDCVDNSVDTWTYLTMLARDHLLHYHAVVGNAHRGTLLTLDFSNTAVIEETATGTRYVVDPWLTDNGVPPVVMPLDDWARTDFF